MIYTNRFRNIFKSQLPLEKRERKKGGKKRKILKIKEKDKKMKENNLQS